MESPTNSENFVRIAQGARPYWVRLYPKIRKIYILHNYTTRAVPMNMTFGVDC